MISCKRSWMKYRDMIHDMLSVVGDWNANVGEQVGEKGIVGKFGMA